MDLLSFLATLILVTSVITLIVAVAAYIAYKIREVRSPKRKKNAGEMNLDEPVFLAPASTQGLLSRLEGK